MTCINLLEMCTPQACLPVHQTLTRFAFSPAVTLRALWLHVDFWYCAMWNLRPHFEVLYYSWSVRGEHGKEETERLIAIFWNWYGNLVMCWFTTSHLWVLQYWDGCMTFRILLTLYQHCWSHFGKSRCWLVFVWAFRIWRTEESLGSCDGYSLFIGISY